MSLKINAPVRCPDCNTRLKVKIMHSNAGFYLGTECECGPYSRESIYYNTRGEAKEAFEEFKSF